MRQLRQRLLNIGVGHGRQRTMDRLAGRFGQARAGVAAVLAQFSLGQLGHLLTALGRQPTAFYQDIGQRRLLAVSPQRARLDELLVRNQLHLQGQHAEQQVVIGAHRSFRGGSCAHWQKG